MKPTSGSMLQQNNNNNYSCRSMSGSTSDLLQTCPIGPLPLPSRKELRLGDMPLVRGLRAWTLCFKNHRITSGLLRGEQPPSRSPTGHSNSHMCPMPADAYPAGEWRGMGYGMGLDARQTGIGLVTVATLKTSEGGGKTQTQCLFLRTEKGSCLYSAAKSGTCASTAASALVGGWLRDKAGVGGGRDRPASRRGKAPNLPEQTGANRVRMRLSRRWRKPGPGQERARPCREEPYWEASGQLIVEERQEDGDKGGFPKGWSSAKAHRPQPNGKSKTQERGGRLKAHVSAKSCTPCVRSIAGESGEGETSVGGACVSNELNQLEGMEEQHEEKTRGIEKEIRSGLIEAHSTLVQLKNNSFYPEFHSREVTVDGKIKEAQQMQTSWSEDVWLENQDDNNYETVMRLEICTRNDQNIDASHDSPLRKHEDHKKGDTTSRDTVTSVSKAATPINGKHNSNEEYHETCHLGQENTRIIVFKALNMTSLEECDIFMSKTLQVHNSMKEMEPILDKAQTEEEDEMKIGAVCVELKKGREKPDVLSGGGEKPEWCYSKETVVVDIWAKVLRGELLDGTMTEERDCKMSPATNIGDGSIVYTTQMVDRDVRRCSEVKLRNMKESIRNEQAAHLSSLLTGTMEAIQEGGDTNACVLLLSPITNASADVNISPAYPAPPLPPLGAVVTGPPHLELRGQVAKQNKEEESKRGGGGRRGQRAGQDRDQEQGEDEFGMFMQAEEAAAWSEGCTEPPESWETSEEPPNWTSDWTDSSFHHPEDTWAAFPQHSLADVPDPAGQWWPIKAVDERLSVAAVFVNAFPASRVSPCCEPDTVPTLTQVLRHDQQHATTGQDQGLLDNFHDLNKMIGQRYKKVRGVSRILLFGTLCLDQTCTITENRSGPWTVHHRLSPGLSSAIQGSKNSTVKRRLSYDYNKHIM